MAKPKATKVEKKYGYVVTRRTFGYDDSWHHAEDGGTPVKIFDDKAAADEEALARTVEELRGFEAGNYFEELDALHDYSDKTPEDLARAFDKALDRKVPPVGEQYDFELERSAPRLLTPDDPEYFDIPESATDEQLRKVAKLFKGLQFYYVLKVEKE